MSDYLGPNQTRVLDSSDRSFESVTYQKRKPPLSCEKNLDGNLASSHAQKVSKFTAPSGFASIGALKNEINENQCNVGDILTSSSFTANTFKFIALDKGEEKKNLIAWVNGWPILIQGSNSLDENNIIVLDPPPTIGYRVDFVFLEVWRKLIDTDDTIFKYGNFLYGGTNPANDLIDPAIGIETTRRIQIQYRIRVAPTDIENYPSGFDPNQVVVQGPLLNPLSTCSQAYFSQIPGDSGLWRAGAGDSAAQEELGTVDGYTYAIPMFAVARRNTGSYHPDNRSNGAGYSLSNYSLGVASDRPDNLYNDWIVANDILDMRHRIAPAYNFKEICESGFQKLYTGKLRGKMEKTTLGEDHFGAVLVQADAISNVDKPGSDLIGQGDGIRRAFSNAEITQSDSLVEKTIFDKVPAGIAWANNDTFQLSTTSYPAGSIITSVDEIYTSSGSVVDPSDYSVSGLNTSLVTVTITDATGAALGSLSLRVDYTIDLDNGSEGLTAVPESFLEFRKEDSTSSIATQDADIRVRSLGPVVASDGTHFSMLSNKGGPITESYDFGHQMKYHTLGNGSTSIELGRVIEGYNILGVADLYVAGSQRLVTSVFRNANTYYINFSGSSVSNTTDIEVVLYTDNKFFTTNKQGRGITDTFEMSELTPIETPTGILDSFTVDSTNKALLALASNNNYNGNGFAYVDGTMVSLSSSNKYLPADTTKSRAVVDFASAPGVGSLIEIPFLMRSAITASEGYTCFYHTVPYQGLLDSTVIGALEAVGPALTTTAGSGSIDNFTYSEGTVIFNEDSTDVQGSGTSWLSNIKSGYQISLDSTPSKKFIISNVYSDTLIQLKSPAEMGSAVLGEAYTIEALDRPAAMANVIDRLPAYTADNDGEAKNENISTVVTDANPTLETRIISKIQDMLHLEPNTVTFGLNSAGRGRTQINMDSTDAPLGLNNLGLKFEKLDSTGVYQKTYQSYILNKDNEGELYLMVVGSETDNSGASRFFNEASNNDSVDIFQLPGRPLAIRRTQ